MIGSPLNFLVKLIDARENLSVQVHPNDKWAHELENSRGKTECWLIMNAEPGAGIFLGLKTGAPVNEFVEAVRSGQALDSLLRFFPVKRGDFFSVPAGAIHAIGAGVTLLEVQQSSGITYRVWDWSRTDRELHIEKALKVLDPHAVCEVRYDLLSPTKENLPKSELLLRHPDFECRLNEANGPGWFVDLKTFAVQKADVSPFDQFIFVK